MESLSPSKIVDACSDAGASKMKKSSAVLLLLGALSGAILALASAATNTAVYGVANVWTARTICGLLFPFGLGLIVLMGGELFTGNCLMPVALLNGHGSLLKMLRNWVLVYLGNLAGSLLVAWICVNCGQLNYSGGALAVYTIRLGAAKCAIPFGNGLGLGILCNLLVCMGVLAAMSAKDTMGKIAGAFLPVCYFVLCGFEHCIANLYYISAGMMAAQVPEYARLAAEAGIDMSCLTVGGMLSNLIPVTLGNILGGAGLGILMWYCHHSKAEGGSHL